MKRQIRTEINKHHQFPEKEKGAQIGISERKGGTEEEGCLHKEVQTRKKDKRP